ncbi:hypothetical protein TIFTF001_011324 [Ficus carica]|uniref:Uncharacterized protein n=1 Tax=Ficus carica TaxID=3494 RepID=A0AA87ZRI6_FICCA|nr:hypothetical protein TIFTF001_011324 [Ficus carica]
METRGETAMEETPIQSEKAVSEHKTPTPIPQTDQTPLQTSPNSGIDLRKPATPDRLKVPKAFKYPERYRSPTDSMMSPVTKGLLARSRKGGALLPPSKNHHKIHDLRLQDVSPLQEIKN